MPSPSSDTTGRIGCLISFKEKFSVEAMTESFDNVRDLLLAQARG